MATKLKNLKISKVDFVDEGANPDAHIKLFKRNSTEDGANPNEKNSEKGTGVFKKLFSFIGKAAGMNQDEIDGAMEEIQKGDSVSFNEKFNEAKNRKIADEIWDIVCDSGKCQGISGILPMRKCTMVQIWYGTDTKIPAKNQATRKAKDSALLRIVP